MADWASSSSSAPSTTGSSSYDVFLSFSGQNNPKNFTAFLNLALKNRGIIVCTDDEKLWTGEAIGPPFLECSKISIPILSECYVKSKWCLQELAQMVQCQISNNQKVLPIFFNVEPWHVRHQIGSLEETFQEHEKNLEPHIIESWREALRVNDCRDQAELVELIVKRVLGELATFDVFLNFRGEGTHKSFTGHLYHVLKSQGIRAFMDSYKLWDGEEIGLQFSKKSEGLSTGDEIGPTLLRALHSSRISIVVLSKNYADSRWCLMELAQIVQCQRSNGQKVLPIFYHVRPYDVRRQTGRFEQAFEEHKIDFERDTIDSWREALRVVANFSGVFVDETMDQAEVVDRVVKKVLNELAPNSKFEELMQMVKTFKEFVINSSKRITSLETTISHREARIIRLEEAIVGLDQEIKRLRDEVASLRLGPSQ